MNSAVVETWCKERLSFERPKDLTEAATLVVKYLIKNDRTYEHLFEDDKTSKNPRWSRIK